MVGSMFRFYSAGWSALFSVAVCAGAAVAQNSQAVVAEPAKSPWPVIADLFNPPVEFKDVYGPYGSLLKFEDGREVKTAEDWSARRAELVKLWNGYLGPWPKLIEHPKVEVLEEVERENFRQQKVRIEIAPGQMQDARLLIPNSSGKKPAVLVVFYEPETSIGLKEEKQFRDFGLQLARRGFVTLNIGTPGGNAWKPEIGSAVCQPLSFHAYVAANCYQILADRSDVDAARIGVTGHSYGGKWALFAGALDERFAAVAVSDPGIVFDETRSNVNYWEPWYLGLDAKVTRKPGIPSAENPRTGVYAALINDKRDLHEVHSLIAPRPFFVSGGSEDPPTRWHALNRSIEVNRLLGAEHRVGMSNRPDHSPNADSNAKLYAFFEHFLGGR
ncbi:MAG: prolyl oligopeptidase family serine peptidase [Pirellulales bacterium]